MVDRQRFDFQNDWGANIFMSADTKPRILSKKTTPNPFRNHNDVNRFIFLAKEQKVADSNELYNYDKVFRLFTLGIPICVEAKNGSVNALLNFAESNGIHKQIFMDHFVANYADIIDPHNRAKVSVNRRLLDFRFEKEPIDSRYRTNYLTLREALKNIDKII